MVGHGGSSAGSYLADPTSPIPSHCASIVATSTLRVNCQLLSWAAHLFLFLWAGMNNNLPQHVQYQPVICCYTVKQSLAVCTCRLLLNAWAHNTMLSRLHGETDTCLSCLSLFLFSFWLTDTLLLLSTFICLIKIHRNYTTCENLSLCPSPLPPSLPSPHLSLSLSLSIKY